MLSLMCEDIAVQKGGGRRCCPGLRIFGEAPSKFIEYLGIGMKRGDSAGLGLIERSDAGISCVEMM